ncbi:MAG: hypothetical protein OSJ60_14015 [Lachnospiraceae bacterium]|nr:hypothetical protein C819_00558 [Lachnospiraceae bacterium 10-1]MCX4352736.1 hypothetical protein [Lachnospiraceae bacterium]
MEFVINDLAIHCQSETTYEAIAHIRKLIVLIKELKKSKILNTIYFDKKFAGIQLAPNYYIEQMLNDSRLTKDERLFIKTILVKVSKVSPNPKQVFEIENKSSSLLAYSYLNNLFVISIAANPLFGNTFLRGSLNNGLQVFDVCLFNLSDVEDIEVHKHRLDIRIYENNPKHKLNYGWGSPMDLNDDIAQKILDKAIPVPNNINHLISHYNNNYYSFRKHHENCFHGYIDNSLSENLKKLLDNL